MAKTNAELAQRAEAALAELVRRGNRELDPALQSVRLFGMRVAGLREVARSLGDSLDTHDGETEDDLTMLDIDMDEEDEEMRRVHRDIMRS